MSMIYTDNKGHRVQTVPSDDQSIVEFYPQGGGFVRALPRIVFDAAYKPETIGRGFSRVLAHGDWNEGAEYVAYSDGDRWNGWSMPYFEFETAMQIITEMNESAGIVELKYDAGTDSFIYENEDWPDEPEIYGSRIIECDGETVKVYGVGAGSWCWWINEGAENE
jgi:hypothetical protein